MQQTNSRLDKSVTSECSQLLPPYQSPKINSVKHEILSKIPWIASLVDTFLYKCPRNCGDKLLSIKAFFFDRFSANRVFGFAESLSFFLEF